MGWSLCRFLQEEANLIDAWVDGKTYAPTLMLENVSVPVLRGRWCEGGGVRRG